MLKIRLERDVVLEMKNDDSEILMCSGEVLNQRMVVLALAKILKSKVQFDYCDAKGIKTNRSVIPEKLVEMDESFYIEGICSFRKQYRTFAIKRMSNLSMI